MVTQLGIGGDLCWKMGAGSYLGIWVFPFLAYKMQNALGVFTLGRDRKRRTSKPAHFPTSLINSLAFF